MSTSTKAPRLFDLSQTCSNISTPTKMSADPLSSTRSSPSRSQTIASSHNANDERSFSSISSIYGKNSGLEVKTCAALQEMVNVRIPPHSDQWWCIVVSTESGWNWFWKRFVGAIFQFLFPFTGILVSRSSRIIRRYGHFLRHQFGHETIFVYFGNDVAFQECKIRFIDSNCLLRDRDTRIITSIFFLQNSPFPLSILPEDDFIASHGSQLFNSLNKSWEPLLSAALGYPQWMEAPKTDTHTHTVKTLDVHRQIILKGSEPRHEWTQGRIVRPKDSKNARSRPRDVR